MDTRGPFSAPVLGSSGAQDNLPLSAGGAVGGASLPSNHSSACPAGFGYFRLSPRKLWDGWELRQEGWLSLGLTRQSNLGSATELFRI